RICEIIQKSVGSEVVVGSYRFGEPSICLFVDLPVRETGPRQPVEEIEPGRMRNHLLRRLRHRFEMGTQRNRSKSRSLTQIAEIYPSGGRVNGEQGVVDCFGIRWDVGVGRTFVHQPPALCLCRWEPVTTSPPPK